MRGRRRNSRSSASFANSAAGGDIELRQTVTRASEAQWTGERGRLTRDALEELVHDPATLCFICGPPALVSAMPAILQDLGIPRERIRIEEWEKMLKSEVCSAEVSSAEATSLAGTTSVLFTSRTPVTVRATWMARASSASTSPSRTA